MTDSEAIQEIILSEIRDLKAAVDHLDHAIRGNGSPGLKADVSALGKRVENLEKLVARAVTCAGALFLAGLPIAWEVAKMKMGWK